MQRQSAIEIHRRRITNAALSRLKRKTGGNLLIVKLPGGKIETVEITQSFMRQILMRFEGLTYGEYGRREGEQVIKSAYQNAIEVNKDTEYLTEQGKLIVDELLKEVADYVKEKHVRGEIN